MVEASAKPLVDTLKVETKMHSSVVLVQRSGRVSDEVSCQLAFKKKVDTFDAEMSRVQHYQNDARYLVRYLDLQCVTVIVIAAFLVLSTG
jgi:hypothetical protein